MFGDVDASRGHLLASLKRVTGVRKQDGPIREDEQQASAAAETGEVQDVRQVGDQQGVRANLGKSKPEPFDPAPVRLLPYFCFQANCASESVRP
jgi:hypothetical protein